MFAIKVCDNVKIVGHLPIDELTSVIYRRSSTIREGLKIPAKVTVTMPGTVKNHLLMEKCKDIVNERYAELKDEEVLGSFLALISVEKVYKRVTRSEKTLNREGRPKKTITDKVKTSDSFFVKSRKRTKARLTWLWKKEKNKTNTDPVTITIDQKDTFDV